MTAWSLAVVGTPLVMWGLQAAFKGLAGTTPAEAFIRVALLPPVSAVLFMLGLNPDVNGQMISFEATNGPLTVDVGAACSGVQAMALFGGVLALYLMAERPAGRRLAFWSIIGIVGVYAANLLRLLTLMFVGYFWGGPALEQFHAQAGWIFFVAWALIFVALARSRPGRRARTASGSARADEVKPSSMDAPRQPLHEDMRRLGVPFLDVDHPRRPVRHGFISGDNRGSNGIGPRERR